MPKAAKAPTRAPAKHNPLGKKDANTRKASASESASDNPPASKTKGKGTSTATASTTASSSTDNTNPNYLIQIALWEIHDPPITRTLSIPPTTTFARLHEILQAAFGWANYHAHSFEVANIEHGHGMCARAPPLLTIHPDPEMFDMFGDGMGGDVKTTGEVTLEDVYEKEGWKAQVSIMYTYDFGDSWEHIFTLLGRATPGINKQVGAPEDVKVMCVSGQGHACAEDAGSVPGWEHLRECFEKPRSKDDGRREWYKTSCANGDPKGLKAWYFDTMECNGAIEEAGLHRG